ncbi:DUF2267 domain-containing protein [Wenxinia marina]|nr:DUF2267 domain-containing protein [Wenxinia marina]
MPWTYRHASAEWRRFLDDFRAETDLVSDNSAYTAIQGVLHAFRRRLTVAEALGFADMLPAVVRAIFVEGWDTGAPTAAPGTRADWTAEARALRPDHNLTPDNAVEACAVALRRQVRAPDIDRALARLPPFASEFWSTPSHPSGIAARIG